MTRERSPVEGDGRERRERLPVEGDGRERRERSPVEGDGRERRERSPVEGDGGERRENMVGESHSSVRAQEHKTTSGQEKCREVPTLANECDTPSPESSLIQPSPEVSGHSPETTIEMLSMKTVSENATSFVSPPACDSDTEEGEIVDSSEGEEEGAIFDGEGKAGRVEEEVDSTIEKKEGEMVDSSEGEEEGEMVDSSEGEEEGEMVDSSEGEEEGEMVDSSEGEEEGEMVDSSEGEEEGEMVDSSEGEEEGEMVDSSEGEEEGEIVDSRMEEEEGEIVDEEGELVDSDRREEEMVGIKWIPEEWEKSVTEGQMSVASESCGLGEQKGAQKARRNRLRQGRMDLVQTKGMELKVTPLPLLQSSGKQPGGRGKRVGCKAAHTPPRKRQRMVEPPSCLSPPSLEATPEHILPGYRLRSRRVDFWEIAPKRQRSDGKVAPH